MAAFREDLDDAGVRLENMHADEFVEAGFIGELAFVIDG